jgi:hypothetical protein
MPLGAAGAAVEALATLVKAELPTLFIARTR